MEDGKWCPAVRSQNNHGILSSAADATVACVAVKITGVVWEAAETACSLILQLLPLTFIGGVGGCHDNGDGWGSGGSGRENLYNYHHFLGGGGWVEGRRWWRTTPQMSLDARRLLREINSAPFNTEAITQFMWHWETGGSIFIWGAPLKSVESDAGLMESLLLVFVLLFCPLSRWFWDKRETRRWWPTLWKIFRLLLKSLQSFQLCV